MSERNQPLYSIAELASLGGVSRRTVRYYVQRGLLPAPEGAGRGSFYTAQHLDTLIRIRELQEKGTPLEEIAARLAGRPLPAPAPLAVRPSTWTRLEVEPGVEIHLSGRRLSSGQLEALVETLRAHLNPPLDPGDEP